MHYQGGAKNVSTNVKGNTLNNKDLEWSAEMKIPKKQKETFNYYI